MIKISFNNKIYKIDKDKLLYVLSKLESKDVKEDEIEKLLNKYKLYDEYFLENILLLLFHIFCRL